MSVIGFDTSNYTTSISYFDGHNGINESKLLPVKAGTLGLRQSDAVFQHIKSLPELSGRLFSHIGTNNISAIGVSTRPRAVDGSYMPCFMVGVSHAQMLADAMDIPIIPCSHQQGHIAAAAWSAKRMDLLDTDHLAWHLSGGTTELLLVQPDGKNVSCQCIGGTTDISAGQLIDRTGLLLGLPFPAGKHLDAASKDATNNTIFKVKCDGAHFSLSGMQNKAESFYNQHHDACECAAFVLRCVSNVILRATKNALADYPGLPVIFSGGVASNALLRKSIEEINPIFAEPRYSTDNAMGVAVLAHRISGG